MLLEGWGRFPRHESEMLVASAPGELAALLHDRHGMIARGNGRAYGDAAIGSRISVSAKRLNRMKAFDPATGCCQKSSTPSCHAAFSRPWCPAPST